MQFLKVGHFTQKENGTGVTVFIFENKAKAVYVLAGSSPATHEITALELDANVRYIDAITFVGGSAFGLSAVQGVMQWCQEHNLGHATTHGIVPIVPAASIYDLAVKKAVAPMPDQAYQACLKAYENNKEQGPIGAGTGASVGKLVPGAQRMSGGVGCAELTLPNGVTVLAYAVVNSLGDVRDSSGNIIAGARLTDGQFANCESYLLAGHEAKIANQSHTTLVSVFTNADFTKIELKRIAKVAIAGMARAISPIFTRFDGDILFCVSLGDKQQSEEVVSVMAAEVVRLAILNAVKESGTLP